MAPGIVLAVLLSACSLGPGTEVTGRRPSLPGCDQAQEFTFIGRTSLDALGLDEFGGGPDGAQIGTIWVTADQVQMDAPPGPAVEPTRMVCVEWADGSGMTAPLPDNWQLPGTAEPLPPSTTMPVAPLVLVVVVAIIVGVSFLAFRRERPADG